MLKGYFLNGFMFRTKEYGETKKTMNSGMLVKESCYNDYEHDFYGTLMEIIELEYFDTGSRLISFKCHRFDTERGVRVHPTHGLLFNLYEFHF